MDAAHLTRLFLLAGAGALLGRFVLTSLERAGDGVTGAFTTTLTGSESQAGPAARGWGWDRPFEQEASGEAILGVPEVVRAGSFVVPIRAVAPIRFRRLPV